MLHLIDHELVELTDLRRYVLATQRNVDPPKVDDGHHARAEVVDLTRPLPPRWSIPVLKRSAASGPQCIRR